MEPPPRLALRVAEQDDEPIILSWRYADWIPRLVLGSAVSRRAGAQ